MILQSNSHSHSNSHSRSQPQPQPQPAPRPGSAGSTLSDYMVTHNASAGSDSDSDSGSGDMGWGNQHRQHLRSTSHRAASKSAPVKLYEFIYIIDLYRRFDVHKMLGASSYGEQPSNAFTWQHALISLREISIYVSLLLVFYCKC